MKHHKRSPLTVKKVTRYNKAKYPSWEDPNPIEHPETMPYPFTAKFLNSFLGIGLAGSMFFSSQEESNDLTVLPEPTEIHKDSLQNSFTMENAGVPYMPASFGTGLPSRLVREQAISVINKVFTEEGVLLKEDVSFDNKKAQFIADGYNEDLKIGFLWMDYNNFGEGMVTGGRYYDRSYAPKKTSETLKEQYDFYVRRTEQRIRVLRTDNRAHSAAFYTFLENDFETLTDRKKEKQFYNQYLNYRIQSDLLSKSYLLDRSYVKTIKEKIKTGKHSDLVLAFEVLHWHINFIKLKEDFKIEKIIEDLASFLQKEKSIWDREKKVYPEMYGKTQTVQRIGKENQKLIGLMNDVLNVETKNRSNAIKKLDQYIDLLKIDFSEATKIDKASSQKKYFVAPISQRDNRFIYSRMSYHPTKQEQANQYKRLIEHAESEERKAVFDKGI